MAEKIRTNTNRMQRDAGNIQGCIDRINHQYSDLVQKKTQLDAMWDGPASETFKHAFDDDLTALQTMIANLQKVYNYENMAKECYIACEQQISGVISDI
jgi:WXG100 family type VII secretion target